MDFVLQLIQNPAVQGGLVLIALRLIPNDYLAGFFSGIGKTLSLGGNKYMGRLWDEVVENTLGVCLRAFLDGLRADNKPTEPQK